MKQKRCVDIDFENLYDEGEIFFDNLLSNAENEGEQDDIEKQLGITERELILKRKYVAFQFNDSFNVGEYYIVTKFDLIHPRSGEVVGHYSYIVDENEAFIDEFLIYYRQNIT